jgi:prolipoprotein diacylglyceryl transferase
MVWDIDREIVTFGGSGLALRWYSLLFALGIVVGYFIVQQMFKREGKPLALLDSLLFHVVIGTVVGARLAHCLLYEPGDYLSDPIRILKVWEGGLASHGGFAGVMIALLLFCRKHKEISWFWIADRMTVPAMITGGFIRIGNFFNSEIVGKPATVPWAVTFKRVDMIPRHPTQIYEAIAYLAIAGIEYAYYRAADRKPKEGRMFGLVLILGYSFRVVVEAFKENQVPFENALPLNMGQLLSLPWIALGFFFVLGYHERFPLFQRGFSGYVPATAGAGGGDGPSPTSTTPRRGQLRRQSKKARSK